MKQIFALLVPRESRPHLNSRAQCGPARPRFYESMGVVTAGPAGLGRCQRKIRCALRRLLPGRGERGARRRSLFQSSCPCRAVTAGRRNEAARATSFAAPVCKVRATTSYRGGEMKKRRNRARRLTRIAIYRRAAAPIAALFAIGCPMGERERERERPSGATTKTV